MLKLKFLKGPPPKKQAQVGKSTDEPKHWLERVSVEHVQESSKSKSSSCMMGRVLIPSPSRSHVEIFFQEREEEVRETRLESEKPGAVML